jgi:hypothetical protein
MANNSQKMKRNTIHQQAKVDLPQTVDYPYDMTQE